MPWLAILQTRVFSSFTKENQYLQANTFQRGPCQAWYPGVASCSWSLGQRPSCGNGGNISAALGRCILPLPTPFHYPFTPTPTPTRPYPFPYSYQWVASISGPHNQSWQPLKQYHQRCAHRHHAQHQRLHRHHHRPWHLHRSTPEFPKCFLWNLYNKLGWWVILLCLV